MSNGFGKASIDPQFEGFKYYKLRTPDSRKGEEEFSLVLRLLPSMKSYRDSGAWKFFYGQHYGHYGVNPRDPSRPRARPFGCIQRKNNKTKQIEVHCPKCDQVAKQAARRDARENELAKEHGFDEETRKSPEFRQVCRDDAKLRSLNEWLQKHNCDKKFWINVADKDWNFGVLQLSYTATQALVKLLKDLEAEGVDAFDPTAGLWLKFTRTGQNPKVVDSVKPLEEIIEVNGRKLKSNVPAPMTEELIEKALRVCPDLKTDVVKFISAETMEKLIACSGDPEEVDRIWPPEVAKEQESAAPAKKAAEKPVEQKQEFSEDDLNPGSDELPEESSGSTVAEQPKQQPKQEAKSEPAPSAEDDEEAAALAALERARAKRAAKEAAAKEAAAPASKPSTKSDDPITDPKKFIERFSVAKQ